MLESGNPYLPLTSPEDPVRCVLSLSHWDLTSPLINPYQPFIHRLSTVYLSLVSHRSISPGASASTKVYPSLINRLTIVYRSLLSHWDLTSPLINPYQLFLHRLSMVYQSLLFRPASHPSPQTLQSVFTKSIHRTV